MPEEKGTEDQSEDTQDTSEEDTSEGDDSSEEDTSDEESDDTSDDDSEGDDEGDSSEEEDSEAESEGKKQLRSFFANPKSIPKELRPAFKAMQAQFTRKMQAASTSITKAQAFDRIAADPGFRAWAKKRAEQMKQGRDTSEDDSDDSDTDSSDTGNGKLTSKSIEKIVQRAIASALEPMRKQQQNAQIEQEFKQFRKSNPGWEAFKEEMSELMSEHPTLTYEMAYKFASQGVDSDELNKRNIKAKKNAKTSKPNKMSGKEPLKPKKNITVRESYDLAKKMLGLGKEK